MDPTFRSSIPQVPFNRPRGRFQLNPRTLLLIGLVIVAIIIGFVLLANSGDKTGPLQVRLSARLATLEKMSSEGKKNLVSGDLREFNSRLSIQLISDQKAIGDALNVKGTDKDIVAAEADTASFETLEDARLNNRYDASYRRIVSEKLDSTTALIKELYDKTHTKSLKNALGSSYRSLKQLETQLTPTTTDQ